MLKWCVKTHGYPEGNNEIELENNNRFMRGSDPLLQTARGRLQRERSKLNEGIDRELKLRAGAENLFKATDNRKLRETIALELQYVNSNLQLLKEELADLNSSVEVYQSESAIQTIPMIPLGLKETKDVDFSETLENLISEHYYEDANKFTQTIRTLNDIRQACRTPVRNETGIQLLFDYYNQLYFVEKRFFTPNKVFGTVFEWYDSLTGVPSSQRTVGFEKGSVLFNIAALYTQIGARQDRTKPDSTAAAIESFQRAAGAFKYLQENFSHAPSMDMQQQTLRTLASLMMSQAQECILEKLTMCESINSVKERFRLAHEASMVSQLYKGTHCLMKADKNKDYVPFSWISIVEVKYMYFKALSHYHTALGILDFANTEAAEDARQMFAKLHVQDPMVDGKVQAVLSCPPESEEQSRTFARAHLRESILAHEEALRIHHMSRQLRRIDTFQEVLRLSHERLLRKYSQLEEEDDFSDLLTVPAVQALTQQNLDVIPPDFSKYKVDDLFQSLGPVVVFSARHKWTRPHIVALQKEPEEEYGFSVRGDAPVIVVAVETGSIAQRAGLKTGDFFIAIGDSDVKWKRHDDIVSHIRTAGNHLVVTVITPIDRNFLDPEKRAGASNDVRPTSSVPILNGTLDKKSRQRNKSGSSWTLRRRSRSKDKKGHKGSDAEIMVR